MQASVRLKRFPPSEIIITQDEAKEVYEFFFKESQEVITAISEKEKWENLHIEFAQALLVEGLDRSYDMGFVEILFKSFTDRKGAINSTKKILKKFGKKSFKHWFDHANEDDLWDNPEIYESVRVFIRSRWKTVAIGIIIYNDSTGY